VITLNSQTKGLTNEEVRIISIERGIRGNEEFMSLSVANKEYSQRERTVEKAIAELENRANTIQDYDQYPNEYSNQNRDTMVGGYSCFKDSEVCLLTNMGILGTNICGCSGDWLYLNANFSAPAHVIQAGTLNINTSSAFNTIDGCLIITECLSVGEYTLPQTDGTSGQVLCTDGSGTVSWGTGGGDSLWQDDTNPYIKTCGGCGISMTGDLYDSDSTHVLGVASSPGAFKEVNAACGIFTTRVYAPTICGTTIVRGADICATDDVLAGDDVIAGGDVCGTLGQFDRLNINASSACTFYVSGNGVYSGTLEIIYADTTCACASRRFKVPVGTNCY